MNRTIRSFITVIGIVATGALVVACDDIIKDPTFREWCGDTLCAWNLDEGHIAKAPTWTEKDYGVSFLDTPTSISQRVTASPHCMEVSMIANVDPSAQMSVGFDFDSDGTIDFEQPIGATSWNKVVTDVTAPTSYDGMTVYLKKEGIGNAVVAELQVQSKDTCGGPPVALKPLALGEPCNVGDGGGACTSGVCCAGLCSECCDDTVAHAFGDPVKTCGADASCTEIKTDSVRGFLLPAVPSQCDPGGGTHASGAPCIADDDCASKHCDGTIIGSYRGDDDGGSVACNASLPDAGGDGCIVTSVVGGTCR